MVDVDYYLDMEFWLDIGRPVLLYTNVVEDLLLRDSEHQQYFDGTFINESSRGSDLYKHQLWDYSGESVSGRTVTHRVYRYRVGKNRHIILLEPWCVHAPGRKSIQRLEIERAGDYVIHSKAGGTTQILCLTTLEMATLDSRLVAAAASRYQLSSKVTVGDVDAVLKNHGVKDYASAAILAGAMSTLYGERDSANPVRYTHVYEGDEPEPLRQIDQLESPVDTLPHQPEKTTANGEAAELLRHQNVANRMEKLPEPYSAYAREFASRFPRGTVLPYDVEVVTTKQDKPTQKHRNAQALSDGWDTKCAVKAFIKAEAYEEDKDPRNISNVSVGYQLALSQYTYAVKAKILKDMPWYCPARPLPEIAGLLHEFASRNPKIVETDFSRFDGTVSEALRREVEFAVYQQV